MSWLVPVVGLVVLVLVAGGAMWATLDWLERVAAVRVDPNAAIGGKDYVVAKLDVVKIALSIVAGGGALFALYLAVRRQTTAERDLRARLDAQAHTEDDARARRVTELYTKAADQLGSDKAPVRLAGLYALERLGQDNPDQRPTIANLWCAYLRMPYNPPPPTTVHQSVGVPRPLLRNPRRRTGIQRPDLAAATSPDPTAAHAEEVLERDVRLSVQRLLTKHLRLHPDNNSQSHHHYWPEIPDLDLTAATLIDLDASSCVLPAIRMDRAIFTAHTRFYGATFTDNATFDHVTFTGDTTFEGATFTGAARFDHVTFTGAATFDHVTFTGDTTFEGATFTGDAEFNSVTFTGDAEFEGATFASEVGFDRATFTDNAWFRAATFANNAGFNRANFTGTARFEGATFTGAAEFDGADFASGVWYDDATFSGDAWFRDATFTGFVGVDRAVFHSTAKGNDARVRLIEGATSEGTWPPGWTCVAVEPTGGDGQWGQLVPVPVVLDQHVVVDTRPYGVY